MQVRDSTLSFTYVVTPVLPKTVWSFSLPKITFTHRALMSIKPDPKGRIEYWDQGMNGRFGLRVATSGKKTWVVMYRINQRLRRYTIGNFDDIPLVDARAKAKEILHFVATGKDPQEEKVQDRKAETFSELAAEYIEKHAKPNKRSWKEDQRMLYNDVLPYWSFLKANKIKRRDVIVLLDTVLERGAEVLANRVLALVRKIFNFGIERDILEFNPCLNIKQPIDEKKRQGQRVLNFEEIRKVWATLNDDQNILIRGIIKMRLLTAQRGIEIRSMKWENIDFESKIWTIPPEVVKNKLQHRVPLSKQALELIYEIRDKGFESSYIFPSPTSKTVGHINNITRAIERIRNGSKVSFVDRDIRRTVASHMAGELQIPRLVISKILNHSEGGVTRIYDRHSYDNEKREALERWGNLFEEIINCTYPQSKVINLMEASSAY